MALDS